MNHFAVQTSFASMAHRLLSCYAIGACVIFLSDALAQDRINVNLYGFGSPEPDSAWTDPEARETVKLTPEASAGINGFVSNGWQNIAARPGITKLISSQGKESAMNLISQSRSAPYYWTRTRKAATHGNPNAAILDGKSLGTFGPGDGSQHSVIEITDIPFDTYDVAIYLGNNQDQAGNGRGTIRINANEERFFKVLPSEPDGTFIEIIDATTPGNTLIFRGLSGPTFHMEIRGDGLNHLGPAAFQIVESMRADEPSGITGLRQLDGPRRVIPAGSSLNRKSSESME